MNYLSLAPREELLYNLCVLHAEGIHVRDILETRSIGMAEFKFLLKYAFSNKDFDPVVVTDQYNLWLETCPVKIWGTLVEIFKVLPESFWSSLQMKPTSFGQILPKVKVTEVNVPPALVEALCYYYWGRFK